MALFLLRMRRSMGVLAVVLGLASAAVAAPQQAAEITLHALPGQSKWLPKESPLFGEYLASGEGAVSGGLAGRIVWDLYEDQSREDRHPAWFLGYLEREGRRFPFVIVGIYTPDSADRLRWRISGTITFDDAKLLGAPHAPITGLFEANSMSARYAVWIDRDAR